MQEGKQQGLGSIAGVADTYWGRNKRTFYGGWSGKGDYCHGNPVFCSGCHFEYEFLRIMEGKMEHSCKFCKSVFLPEYAETAVLTGLSVFTEKERRMASIILVFTLQM